MIQNCKGDYPAAKAASSVPVLEDICYSLLTEKPYTDDAKLYSIPKTPLKNTLQ